ncbi:Isy1-like splicing factor [Dipodascopsis tothii]|uniref:Isy1-like splicing factor n=1 Tax=Dipodascopsis tothii TaxID=44089 RepID=UPI0034CD9BD0
MSRNSEKAQSMLYRFREQEAAEMGIVDLARTRRPKVVSECDSIPLCEKWRGQVVKEIGRKVTKIQDPALSDYQIRDLNDEINKLLREKHVWELQLRKLGGPNYIRFGQNMTTDDGTELTTTRGYKYFGRARDLPGVKELLQPAKPEPAAVRDEYRTELDAAYFGYSDADEARLAAHEAAREAEAEAALQAEAEPAPEDWRPIERLDAVPTREQVEEYLAARAR